MTQEFAQFIMTMEGVSAVASASLGGQHSLKALELAYIEGWLAGSKAAQLKLAKAPQFKPDEYREINTGG